MKKKQLAVCLFVGALAVTNIIVLPAAPFVVEAQAAAKQHITYKLPVNLEKYLFINQQMVTIKNPHPAELVEQYRLNGYLTDREGGYESEKTMYTNRVNFLSSKKGFLMDVYHFIGILPPVYPPDVNINDLNERISKTELFTPESIQLRKKRGEINLQARLQALINAGYVKPEEIDDGPASKQFVATVLYRMFGKVRPYYGGIDLKDSEDTAVRWAVEVGLPGFAVDSKGFVYPNNRLSLNPIPVDSLQEYAYSRLFDFLTLIMPGKKTANGWEYYQLGLKPGMMPVRAEDVTFVNGMPFNEYGNLTLLFTAEFEGAKMKIAQASTPRFAQTLELARKDARKPRVWDWSRDLIHNPKFAKEVAAYRKSKSAQNVNAVYQAVRNQYNLNPQQDSPAIIKSVLNNVK